jgi:hypothetical protein
VLFATALLFAFGTVGPGFAGSITSIIVWRTITGFGTLGPILAAVGIGTVNVVATILAMGLIDRAGRRTPVDRRPGADGPEPDRSRRCSVGREGRCLGQHGRHIVPGPYKASGNNSDISTSGSGPKLTPNARTNRPRHDFEALGWDPPALRAENTHPTSLCQNTARVGRPADATLVGNFYKGAGKALPLPASC